jgi:hypothetical protein
MEIFKQMGPVVAAFSFFIWRDYKRESAMMLRLDKQSDYIRDTLTDVLSRTSAALVEFAHAVKTRPCLFEALENHENKTSEVKKHV